MDTTAAAPAADELHAPHDRIGKPIAVGAKVTVWGQGRGTVASITGDGQIQVDRDDGSSVAAAPGDLIVLAPAAQPADDAADGASDAEMAPAGAETPPAGDTAPADAPTQPAPQLEDQPDAPTALPPGPDAATEPAPDASPDGAFSWLIDDAGTMSAWLRTDEGDDPVGYLQTDATDPVTTVRYLNAEDWATEVDNLGLHEPDDGASPEIPPEAADAAAAAPAPHAAPPGAEGKAVTAGTFVTLPDGDTGCVDLVITSGTVPGVDTELKGSAAAPAARVTIWGPAGDVYRPTEVKAALPVAELQLHNTVLPHNPTNTAAALVLAAAEHDQQITEGALPASAKVSAVSTKAAYERGMRSWPGEQATTLSQSNWALGRAKTLLTVAAGEQVDGFADTDLLTHGHPLAASENAEPTVTVTATDLDAALAELAP